MLPKLVRECCRCLLESLDINNVIQLLEQSFYLDEQQLRSDCLQYIVTNANAILTGSEILSASRLALEAILEADNIPIRELMMYETAVKWAKHQLRCEMSGDDPTDLQIRKVLGDLLYKIRFPIMKPIEFAEISSGNNLLTTEEKESVYYFLISQKKHSQLKFSTEWRIGKEVWIERTEGCVTWERISGPPLDAIIL